MTFKTLKAARDFARRHLDFVATLEDFDLLCEIGYRQESGTPLTMRDLLQLEISSAATLQRRLRRLRARGAILQTRSQGDARVIEFSLSPKLLKVFARYFELLGTAGWAAANSCAEAS